MSCRASCGALMIMLLLLCPVAFSEAPRKIKVLGTGKEEGMPILASWFSTEPSTDATIIPTRIWSGGRTDPADIRRFMRLYFPRNYDDLLTYDFFFLAQIDLGFFTDLQERWLYDALTEHVKGGVNTRSIISVGSDLHTLWRDSILSSAFPNDVAAVVAEADKEAPWGPIVIKEDEDLPNIMKPFKDDIERTFTLYSGLKTIPKPGSKVLSYTRNREGTGVPIPGQTAHVFYWEWSRSKTFTFQDMVYNDFWSGQGSLRTNPYALDIIVGIVWFSTGRTLPEDPLIVHQFRYETFNYNLQRSLLTSVLDFAESFGANPSRIYVRLQEIDGDVGESRETYLDRDFESAYQTLLLAADDLESLEVEAAKLKNQALFWVYVTEWFAITGISLLAGWAVWWAMIKRSLYREVSVTRSAR